MAKFLVDSNIPQTLNAWQNENFLYAIKLNIERDDSVIWDYAKQHALTIITKDTDFVNRIIVSIPPPKVIHFRLGNMRYSDFRIFVRDNWERISLYSLNFKLVLVYPNSIEGIK